MKWIEAYVSFCCCWAAATWAACVACWTDGVVPATGELQATRPATNAASASGPTCINISSFVRFLLQSWKDERTKEENYSAESCLRWIFYQVTSCDGSGVNRKGIKSNPPTEFMLGCFECMSAITFRQHSLASDLISFPSSGSWCLNNQ